MGKKLYVVHGTKFEVDEKFSIIKPIGYGAYGFVCAAKDDEKNQKVAIKKIPKVFQDLVDGKRILREIKLLAHLRHENIISIFDMFRPRSKETFEDVYIVSELMDTDLHQVIRSKQKLTEEHFQYFIYQTLRGMKYIHSARVLHRDLKPSNILVNGNCDLKICDFGLARGLDITHKHLMTEYVVTRWYRAPELLLMCQEYTTAIDIWSVGCILAELINRKPLFPGRDYVNQLNLITDVLGVPTDEDMEHIKHKDARRYIKNMPPKKPINLSKLLPTASKHAIDLLERMLVFNPAKRITAEEALAHPYLAALHDPNDEPTCEIPFQFEYDSQEMTAQELRDMLWEQSVKFHPLEGANVEEDGRIIDTIVIEKEKPKAKAPGDVSGPSTSSAT